MHYVQLVAGAAAQVRLDKVEQFFEEVRSKSRSRTVVLGTARATGEGEATLHVLIDTYLQKQRAGGWMVSS
jgi:hypothetical protein